MPLEKPAYRDNLERLNEAFPDRECLKLKEVARFLGRDEKTVKRHLGSLFKKGIGVTKASLARELS